MVYTKKIFYLFHFTLIWISPKGTLLNQKRRGDTLYLMQQIISYGNCCLGLVMTVWQLLVPQMLYLLV